MDFDEYLKGNWHELKGKIKEEWNDLTDDDLEECRGRREKIVGKIQKRYGKTHDEAEAAFEDWKRRNAAFVAASSYDD